MIRHQQEQRRIEVLEGLIVKIQNRRKEEVSCRKRMNDTIGSSFREEEAGVNKFYDNKVSALQKELDVLKQRADSRLNSHQAKKARRRYRDSVDEEESSRSEIESLPSDNNSTDADAQDQDDDSVVVLDLDQEVIEIDDSSSDDSSSDDSSLDDSSSDDSSSNDGAFNDALESQDNESESEESNDMASKDVVNAVDEQTRMDEDDTFTEQDYYPDDDGENEDAANVIEETEQFYKSKISQSRLHMAVQGFQLQREKQSGDKVLSATTTDRGNRVVFDPDVVEFEDNLFRKNKCYVSKGEDTILGIKRFISTDTALCILVVDFKHTLLGEAGADLMKDAFVQVFNCVKEISLSDIGEASGAVDQIPRLIYQAQTPGKWYSFGYFFNRTRVKRLRRREKIRSLELFAGAGGSLQGYHNAAFHTVMAVEKDRDSVRTLRANNKDLKVYDGCIRTFSQDFAKMALALGRIDHIHFSSPCQDFSMANRKVANSAEENEPRERADLSLLLVDLIRKTACDTAVFENVVGIWSRKSCRYLHTITADIIKLGYQVQCTVLRACDFGDPQKRPRFFMFIANNNVPLPLIPSATHGDDFDWPYVTVKDALSRVSNDDSLTNMEGRRTSLQPGQHGHIRLNGNDVAPTLCAAARTPFHYAEDRLINVREAATLQSFPEWYTFQGSLTSQYRQVGNAVPVQLATAVAKSVRDVLIYEYEDEGSNNVDTGDE